MGKPIFRARNASCCAGVFFILSLAPLSLNAQSLVESVQAGLTANPSIEAQRLQLDAQKERRVQALSLRRANIQGEANIGIAQLSRNQQGFNGPTTTTTSQIEPRGVALSVEQPLYTGGRFEAAKSVAEIQIRQAEARLRTAELEVIQGIVTAWADVRRDLAIVAVRNDTISALNELLLGAQERFRLGEATLTQAAQAESRLSGERAALATAQASLMASQANFERFTGTSVVALDQVGGLPVLPLSMEEAHQFGRAVNPELLVSRLEEDLARARVREVEAEYNGRLAMRASVTSDQDQGFQGSRNSSAQVQARYSIPLWSGGAAPSRKREAASTAGAARMRAMDLERQVVARVSAAWGRLQAARTSVEASRQQVSSAMLALRGARAEFLYGLGDQLNVLNQQAELASAQVALVQAERDALTSHYGLLFAIGSLDATSFDARPEPSAFVQTSDPALWEEPLIKVQEKLDPKTRQIERARTRAVRAVLGPEE